MKIGLGSDHRGFRLKEALTGFLDRRKILTEDFGTFDARPVDYPDVAGKVAARVASGALDQGILICGSGLDMSIAANKVPGVRAALCLNPDLARMARSHNNANILVLGADMLSIEAAGEILTAWIETDFPGETRHARRVEKLSRMEEACGAGAPGLRAGDPAMFAAIRAEEERQQNQIVLIASENLVSRAVREAQGSVLTNKYAEGYPGKRWYNGCRYLDDAEKMAIDRAKELFGAEHANVQPHCGSSANMAVYFAVLKPGDTILAMKLSHGGHLTHGNSVNFSGRLFKIVSYGVSKETEQIDYDELARLALEHKPRMIVAGASAYSRVIDFKRFRAVADSVGACLLVDMAHIAGLVAGGCHPSPVPFAEFVTGTTHKTLCGPRGGLILCRREFAEEIDRQIFPGIQGGPLMHVVAAKGVCFHEALQPAFRKYQEQVVRNSRALAGALAAKGLRIVSGGTDNHLALVDLTSTGVTGKDAADMLETVNIALNKNAIPFDTRNPFVTSGIRVGTPAVTMRGMGEKEMRAIADIITRTLAAGGDESVLNAARDEVADLTSRFPVP